MVSMRNLYDSVCYIGASLSTVDLRGAREHDLVTCVHADWGTS